MTNISADAVLRHRSSDRWATRRIWIAGALAATLAATERSLDFWSLGGNGSLRFTLRGLLELSQLLLLLSLVGFALGLLIAPGTALWRFHFRRTASSILAIAAIPVCFLAVAKVSLFDPWFWYAIANNSRFEALAASDPLPNGPKYAKIEVRDVSTGFAGINPNHFVALVYDQSDAAGLEPAGRPSIWQTRTEFGSPFPKGKRLYGHLFRVDIFD